MDTEKTLRSACRTLLQAAKRFEAKAQKYQRIEPERAALREALMHAGLILSVADDGPSYGGAIMKGKREEVKPNENDTRYIRRDTEGQFTEHQVEKGRSLAQDRKQKVKTIVPKGQDDRGDQKRKAS